MPPKREHRVVYVNDKGVANKDVFPIHDSTFAGRLQQVIDKQFDNGWTYSRPITKTIHVFYREVKDAEDTPTVGRLPEDLSAG